MRNKLKKIVGTLLTFALAFTIFGGEAKNVSAATSAIVSWSGKESVREIGTSGHVGYILLDRAIVDALPETVRAQFGILYEISETGPAPEGNGMTAEYASLVTSVTGLTNDAVYLLPLNRPGAAPQAISADAGTMVDTTIMGVLLAIEKTSAPYWYFNYYDRDAIDFGNEGGGTLPLSLGKPTDEIKDLPEIEDITISGEKTWIGNGLKPDSITVKLLRNGVEIDSETVVAVGGEWTYEFGEHPVTDEDGNEYDYEIEEVLVDGFTTTYDGFNIINTTDVVIVPEIKGTIEFLKHDDMGSVLEGAEFELYAAEDTSFEHVIVTATSDANGVVRFVDVEEGSYKIKESAAPTGYIKSDIVLDATIAVDEEIVAPVGTPVVNTAIKADVVVTKLGEDEEVLSGAEFTLYENGVKVGEPKVTGLNGKATFEDIPYGTYTMKETKAPNGYVLSEEIKVVKIEDVDDVTVSFSNVKIQGTVQITKVDMEDNEIVLQGAEFRIVDEDDVMVFEGTTNELGKLETILSFGKYTLSEVTAPTDYEKAPGTWAINITEDEEIVDLVIENKMIEVEEVDPLPLDDEVGTVRIKKVDKETNAVLAGVKFRITDKDGDVVFEGLTDDKGMIEEELLVGEYTITEVEALPGYVPNTKSEVVTIKEDGEVVNLTIANKKMYGLVSIKKVDAESGEVLEGAKFKFVDKAGTVILEDYTDEDGMLEVWLPKGEYIISETAAPEDYDKTDETWSVKVTADGQLFKLEVENTMIEVEVVSPVTLPQTGGIPSEFLYILGAFAIFTGMLLTKKRQRV